MDAINILIFQLKIKRNCFGETENSLLSNIILKQAKDVSAQLTLMICLEPTTWLLAHLHIVFFNIQNMFLAREERLTAEQHLWN